MNPIFKSLLLSISILTLGSFTPEQASARLAFKSFQMTNPNYSYYLTGDPSDSKAKGNSGYALIGGGDPILEVFKWLIEKAGHGDVVVLRATEDDIYNKLFWSAGEIDSVETLVIKTRLGAEDPFILEKVKNAEVVFIAGGNQWNYVSMWQGTKLSELLRTRISTGMPIGGTSAGLAILGEYYFSAKNGSVESDEALQDPFNNRMTIDRQLLNIPLLVNSITDSHFSVRERLGRLVTFMGVVAKMGGQKVQLASRVVHGVGVDEGAAILIDGSTGVGRLVGQGNAYLLSGLMPEVCESGKPLTYKTVVGYQMSTSSLFNFKSWTGLNGKGFRILVDEGYLTYH